MSQTLAKCEKCGKDASVHFNGMDLCNECAKLERAKG